MSLVHAAMGSIGKLDWWEAVLDQIAWWDAKANSLEQLITLHCF